MAASSGEARRRLAEGAVHLDGRRRNEDVLLHPGGTYEVRYGKKSLIRIQVDTD